MAADNQYRRRTTSLPPLTTKAKVKKTGSSFQFWRMLFMVFCGALVPIGMTVNNWSDSDEIQVSSNTTKNEGSAHHSYCDECGRCETIEIDGSVQEVKPLRIFPSTGKVRFCYTDSDIILELSDGTEFTFGPATEEAPFTAGDRNGFKVRSATGNKTQARICACD